MTIEQLQYEWNEIRGYSAIELLEDSRHTYVNLVLERYWNDGSPSGFNLSVSEKYAPYANEIGFYLPLKRFQGENCTVLGRPLEFMRPKKKCEQILSDYYVPVHPDFLGADDIDINICSDILAIPTASGRTVAILDLSKDEFFTPTHIKLHYPRCLGRYPRDLYHFKWFSSVESSHAFLDFERIAGLHVHFPETQGMFIEPKNTRGFGFITRTLPADCSRDCLHIPFFSLFAKPTIGSLSILSALRIQMGVDPITLFNLIVLGLVDLYWKLALHSGLLPECNAQNVILCCRPNHRPRILFRDMADVFRDIALRKENGLRYDFCSYKSIDYDSSDLLKRRSFSYDFKLGKYILDPLVKTFSKQMSLDTQHLRNQIVQITNNHITSNSKYFSKDKLAYGYKNKPGQNRLDYVELGKAKYR